MSRVTVVTYHYVRPIVASKYPSIKGLELDKFKYQLEQIAKRFEVISARQLVAAFREGEPLPENSALLTFDDGYLDHYEFAFPELRKRKWSGIFFPPSCAVEDREILDVNKIHYVLASTQDYNRVISQIETAVMEQNSTEIDLANLHKQYFIPNRFDGPEVNFIKRLLQFALPLDLRTTICDSLFRQYVSHDMSGFADHLYVNKNQLIEMLSDGMEVGSHGSRHYWMNQLSKEEQAKDLDSSLRFLGNIGVPRENFYYCFPYGGYNEATLSLLKERGCACAFTTRDGVLDLAHDNVDLLQIPRIDTNHLLQSR